MYKVKGKVRRPTPAMKEVLDEMKAGQILTMRYVAGREVYLIEDRGVSAHTVRGLVDRYLIREVRRETEPRSPASVRSIFVLLEQQPVNQGVKK